MLSTTSDNVPRFITKKWIEVRGQLGNTEDRCKPSKQIRSKTSMLRLDLCDFSDAYIVVKGTVLLQEQIIGVEKNRPSAFKNNAPFISCISKIINTLIDNAEDLDVVMPIYNLIEYSKCYRKTTGSLWFKVVYELAGYTNDINFSNKNVINSESFKYSKIVTGSTYNVDAKITNVEGNEIDNPAYEANKSGKKEVDIAVPLKYMSNFWRTLDMSLINFEVSLILTCFRECVITSMERRVIKKYTKRYFSSKCNISNNRHKIVRSSCYFIN